MTRRSIPMQPRPGCVYVIKAVPRSDYTTGTSKNHSDPFVWPRKGEKPLVKARHFVADSMCGNGLHVWIVEPSMEIGSCPYDLELCDFLVLEVADTPDNLERLGGKAKINRGRVVAWFSTWLEAHDFARPSASIAGYGGAATAGCGGTATAGYRGTAIAGDRGTATAGDRGTATAGDQGTATAGYQGTATAGRGGTATVGDWGTAIAGKEGTATAGYGGIATAGDGGTATAGERGIVVIEFCDETIRSSRKRMSDVGEGGLKPDTAYRLNSENQFEEAPKTEERRLK